MITFIVHLRVHPENRVAFLALMEDVIAQTRANEPGVVHYEVSRSLTEPEVYCIVEVYADADAHAAHMASPWVCEGLDKSAALIDGLPQIRQYVSGDSQPVRQRVASA